MPWTTRKLGEVTEVIAGQSPNGSAYNSKAEGLPFYQGKKEFGDKYIGPPTTWTTEVTKVAEKGDVLMSVRAPVGPVNIASSRCCIGRGLAAIRSGAKLNSDFLFYYLLLKQPEISGNQGAVFASISRSEIEQIPIPIAPLHDQLRIASILDESFAHAEQAIENTRQNLERTKSLVALAASEMMTGGDGTLLRETTVADVASRRPGSIRTGPFGSQLLHSEFVDAGIPVLGIDNAVHNEFRWGKRRYITRAKFRQLSRYQVYPGDVLITIMGTCGRCAVIPDDIPVAINSKHICCISLDKEQCLPEFLHVYFLYHPVARDYLTRTAKGSIMSGLNMGIVRELPLLLPSTARQREIVERLASVGHHSRTIVRNFERKLAALDELKHSLLHHAFTGQL